MLSALQNQTEFLSLGHHAAKDAKTQHKPPKKLLNPSVSGWQVLAAAQRAAKSLLEALAVYNKLTMKKKLLIIRGYMRGMLNGMWAYNSSLPRDARTNSSAV